MYLTNVIKPTHICNLACKYCYNEDSRRPIMTPDILQHVVKKTIDFVASKSTPPTVEFLWHGGEPLVAKLEFYEEVVRLQKIYKRGVRLRNHIQTNGTLLDAQWINFLVRENFSLSVSLDGPRHLNDLARVDHGGKGSYDRVMSAIGLAKDAGISIGVCVVLSRHNKDHVDELFDFLTELKCPFQVIPLNRSGDAVNSFDDFGLEADEYAEPWIKMYDRWLYAGDNYVYCSDFALKTQAILTGAHADCVSMKVCSTNNISTDPDGYVYPCATLSGDSRWLYGNIQEMTIAEMFASPVGQEALNRKVDPHCQECKWQQVCHGGCIARSAKFFGTIHERDYYCPSLYKIYEHIEARLRQSATHLDLGALPQLGTVDARHAPPGRLMSEKVFERFGKETSTSRKFDEVVKKRLPLVMT